MAKPAYFKKDKIPVALENFLVLKNIIEGLEKQFEIIPYDETPYTISLKQIEIETGISRRRSVDIVRDFLEAKKKKYERKMSGRSGARYFISSVSKQELKKWKKYVENLKKGRFL